MSTDSTTKAGERTQHTPGPWTIGEAWSDNYDKANAHIKGLDGSPIAMVYGSKQDNESEANARLIAAALAERS